MAEEIIVHGHTKAEKYNALYPQLKALVAQEGNLVANLANITAALKETFNYFWVGFYLLDNGELVLGPFQGPVACTRIQKGNGVCGTAWETGKTQLVPDVNQFPGHIACNALSKSEIVIPIFQQGNLVAVLDVDSEKLDDFSATDKNELEKIAQLTATLFG